MRAPWSRKSSPQEATNRSGATFTIFQKLLAVIVLLMIIVVGALATSLSKRQLDAMNADLLDKAETFSAVMAVQARSAVAFSDQETAREVLGSLSNDHDVASVRLYTATGQTLFAAGKASRWAPQAIRATAPRVVESGDRVAGVVPVVSLEGPRGTLVLELSTAALERERRRVAVMAALTGLIAFALSCFAAWWIARRLARRLRAIADVATKVADGDLEQQPVNDPSGDEIGLLAAAFNKMVAQLRQLIAHIQEMAQREKDRLETLVNERTAQLESRNVEMRQVFDQVDQGLLIVDAGGALAEERSAAVEQWLGPLPPSRNLVDYVRQFAPVMADWFELTWAGIGERLLPMEVALAQLPSKFEVAGRHLELSYKPFTDSGGAIRVLLVITDVTDAIARQRAKRAERESAALMTLVLRDRRSARSFFTELSELMERLIRPASEAEFRRALHTVKGSCSVAELGSLAELSHELETLADEDLQAAYARAPELQARWIDASAHVQLLAEEAADRLDVRHRDVAQLEAEIERNASPAELARLVGSWREERVLPRFQRFAEHAGEVATRLGKAPFEIRVEVDLDLRLSEERWAPFWAVFVHPLSNAVDHGLLSPDARAEAGRPATGLIRLCARLESEHVAIEIHDDGGGIDWAQVAASARRHGLPAESRADLIEALFHDGMSTRTEVSMSSGRGIGMAALRQVVVKSGGSIHIDSAPDRGTTFRFTWPRHPPTSSPIADDEPHPLPVSHESSRKFPCLVS